MNPMLSDDAVAELPLHRGRAELLEEIMAADLIEHSTADPSRGPDRPRARRWSWQVPAAAALVAVLVSTPAWWGSWDAPSTRGGGEGPPAQVATGGGQGEATGGWVVLDAPGWVVSYSQVSDDGGALSYVRGGQSLEVSWYPAARHAGYVEDRRHIVEPPADGERVELVGRPGQLWAYSPRDHTVISDVVEGGWFEVRGSGMGKAAYLTLLGRLRSVGPEEFESALPSGFVTSDEREQAIASILDDIGEVAVPLLPDGVARSSITSDQNDPYQLGAEVAGGVACAWLGEYETAQRVGDDSRSVQAMAVLGTTRLWPVLQQMDESGDYPEVVWDYADMVAEGRLPEGYPGGLGC